MEHLKQGDLPGEETNQMKCIIPSKLDEGSSLEKKEPLTISYFKLFSTADGFDKLMMFGGLLGAAANGVALPLFAVVFGEITDTLGGLTTDGVIDKVNHVCLYFVYIGIATFVASYLEVALWMWTGARQATRIRQHYFHAVLRQEVAFFDASATTGTLLQGLNQDTLAVQNAIGEKVGNFVHNFVTFLVGIAIAFSKGWSMTLVMLALTPLLVIAGAGIALITARLSSSAAAAYADANSIAQESLANIRTVASFNGQRKALLSYLGALAYPEKVGIRQGFYHGFTIGFMNCTFLCAYALALWFGSTRVIAGEYTGGQVMTVLFSALIGGMSLGQAAPNLSSFQEGRSAGARIWKILDRVPAIDEDAPGDTPHAVEGHIELKNVSFSYPARPDVTVFSNFSLNVPAATVIALVGQSGSGKSTVVQLVERFYDPDKGQVMLDGRDIRTLQLRWYRAQVGLVSQEPTLFATSILENIRYGRPGASQAEVEAAAHSANAHSFISSLPHGYFTQVGDKGIQMSGGQKQRIAIARAILKDPKILLLDEATSALDNHSERIVQAALDKLMVGRTTIVVAHRLSTIRNADIIAVVKEGKVVEQGTHPELVDRPEGAYATLVKLQVSAEQQSPKELEAYCHDDDDDSSLSAKFVDALEVVSLSSNSETGTAWKHESGEPAKEVPKKHAGSTQDAGPEDPKVNAGFSRLAALNAPEWPFLVIGTLASAALGMQMPAFALAVSNIIAVFFNPDTDYVRSEVRKWCWVFAGAGFGSLVMGVLQQYSFTYMGQKLTRRLRGMLLGAILHQDIAWFDRDENTSGALAGRLGTDTAHVRGAVGDQAGLLAQNLVTIIAALIIAFTSSWRVTLVIFATVPVLLFAGWFQGKFFLGFSSQAGKLFDPANQTASECFSSIRTVAAFSLAPHVTALYKEQLHEPTRVIGKTAQVSGIGFGFSQGVMFLVYALAFWFGGTQIKAGTTTFDQLLKVFFGIVLAAFGASQAQMAFPDITKAKGAVTRVFTAIDRKPPIDAQSQEGNKLSRVEGVVELRDITFVYPARPEVTVFSHFDLKVPAGQTVALVGQSGSGKSSVVSLIERFYDPVSGVVTLDGVDIKTLNLPWYRQQIALVSQEPVLFTGTIRENVVYGREDATDAQVEEACTAANAKEFIDASPEGLHTLLGSGGKGIQLSGGQKQRLAIARAIMKQPRILLLDEATSALDATSEALVQQALQGLMRDRTTVVVAHRLSTIRNADAIAVVQQGKILEMGTHDNLMAARKAYFSLVRHQADH